MNKLVDGKVIRREDGKIKKPEGWQQADIEGILKKYS
jgi:predicted HAD superfamily Cof-like phosphohydrolase